MSGRTVGLKGTQFALEGEALKPGDSAPDFKLQQKGDAGLSDVSLDKYAGKTLIISVVPSLDTGVCAMQTKKFNERAAQLPANVAILTVSADLPFAQGRFCGAEGIDKLETASDHRDVSFGKAYGVLINGGSFDRFLARSVFVVGPDKKIKYVEYVSEIPNEPNYDAALQAAG